MADGIEQTQNVILSGQSTSAQKKAAKVPILLVSFMGNFKKSSIIKPGVPLTAAKKPEATRKLDDNELPDVKCSTLDEVLSMICASNRRTCRKSAVVSASKSSVTSVISLPSCKVNDLLSVSVCISGFPC